MCVYVYCRSLGVVVINYFLFGLFYLLVPSSFSIQNLCIIATQQD